MRTAIGIMLLALIAAVAVIAIEPGGPHYRRHDLVALHGAHAVLARLDRVARS